MHFHGFIRAVALSLAAAGTFCMAAGCSSGKDDNAENTQAAQITSAAFMNVTVQYGDNVKTVSLEGGTVAHAITLAGFNTDNYTADFNPTDPVFDGMVINLTSVVPDGFRTENDVTYYYYNGVKLTNAVVGNEVDGFYYTGEDGAINYGYCDGVTVGDTEWNVINGRATVAQSEGDLTLNRALRTLAQFTDSSMSMDDKLYAAFEYIKTSYLEGVPRDPPYRGMDWPIVYANDIFVTGKGDCYSYGAAFAYFGKAIGYDECYACNSGGHGWAEIDGLVYDPEWDIHHSEYSHFGVYYGDTDCDVNYSGGIERGEDYMRIPV